MTSEILTEALVEKAARAICECTGRDPDAPFVDSTGPLPRKLGLIEWHRREAEVRAALTAILPDIVEACARVADKRKSQYPSDAARGIEAGIIADRIRSLAPQEAGK